MHKDIRNGLLMFALGGFVVIFFLLQGFSRQNDSRNEDIPGQNDHSVVVTPEIRFGFSADSFHFNEGRIAPNQFLSNLLTDAGVEYRIIDRLARAAEPVYSVRKLRAGNPYSLISSDSCSAPFCFVYEPNPYKFIRFHLTGEPYVEIVQRPVDTLVKTASGVIEGSLWQTMANQDLDYALIDRMEDALAWSVDFYHIQKGDRFKLIYEDLLVDGETTGVGRLKGAWFESGNKEWYSIWYKSDKYAGFFDLEGRPMKKAFLKSPVRYSRISSRYNKRRFHPIKKRVIPHLGTDYAAPHGTPIQAVASGTVTKAAYTSGNGNYVKIRHDRVYETQYLHMSSFARGIRPGAKVKQGDVIGYVGSTGLATGPHVCFRFWKYGRQINHLNENFPEPDPMHEAELPFFFKKRDRVVQSLDLLEVLGSDRQDEINTGQTERPS